MHMNKIKKKSFFWGDQDPLYLNGSADPDQGQNEMDPQHWIT